MEPAAVPALRVLRRHLHWLCRAPSLLDDPRVFDLPAYLPIDWPERIDLGLLDANGRAPLEQAASGRLGHYFEALYAWVLVHVLGWRILARNQVIRSAVRTVGELDFLVVNPATQAVEHHEIAVKFYLGHAEAPLATLWYGPNSQDRFDLKRSRLLEHQLTLPQRPETVVALSAASLPQPAVSRLFVLGYLFTPHTEVLVSPTGVAAGHLRGGWLRAATLDPREISQAVVLYKPHWLGPWEQFDAPDTAASRAAVERIAAGGTPRLFARLSHEAVSGYWVEHERFFVLPERWP